MGSTVLLHLLELVPGHVVKTVVEIGHDFGRSHTEAEPRTRRLCRRHPSSPPRDV